MEQNELCNTASEKSCLDVDIINQADLDYCSSLFFHRFYMGHDFYSVPEKDRDPMIIAVLEYADLVFEKGYDDKNGARPLRRVIQEEIENQLADKLISDELSKGSILKVNVKDKKLVFKKVHESSKK